MYNDEGYPEELNVEKLEMVHEEIIYSNGSFLHVRRWVKGKHPHLGKILYGFTGWETEITKSVVKPKHLFVVKEENEDKTSLPPN